MKATIKTADGAVLELTTDHQQSSFGVPVLLHGGEAHAATGIVKRGDGPDGLVTAAALVAEEVARGAEVDDPDGLIDLFAASEIGG